MCVSNVLARYHNFSNHIIKHVNCTLTIMKKHNWTSYVVLLSLYLGFTLSVVLSLSSACSPHSIRKLSLGVLETSFCGNFSLFLSSVPRITKLEWTFIHIENMWYYSMCQLIRYPKISKINKLRISLKMYDEATYNI